MTQEPRNKRSFIRFIHNVAGAPPVNIFLNGNAAALNLVYKDIGGYLNVSCGDKEATVELAGSGTSLTSRTIRLQKDARYTAIVLGDVNNLSTIKLYLYSDDLRCPRPDLADLRFIHGIYGAPAVDVYINDKIVFSNVTYSQTGSPTYQSISVGKTKIPGANANYVMATITIAGTKNIVTGPTQLYLIGGGVYTLLASGNSATGLIGLLSHDNPNKCETLQEDFNVQGYMGKWYQIASIPQFYEANCPRATAEYTLLSNRVNVFNTCYDTDWRVVTTITGSASAPDPCEPAALKVTFPNPPPPAPPLPPSPPGPNYLVHNTDYINYAIVGSPTRTSFYILSRYPKMNLDEYEHWLQYAVRLGYDKKQIRPNYHAIKHC